MSSASWGLEVKTETSRAGVVDDGNVAWPERIVEARRQWPEARAEDFERVGRRRWRDRGSGVEYRQADGCPLLAVGTDAVRDVVAFLISGGKIVFLERDVPEGLLVHHGPVVARELSVQVAPVMIQ
jgi:hypothetical protein